MRTWNPMLSLLLLSGAGLAAADEPTVACVLHVEDQGWSRKSVTEDLGLALYGRFLEEGPYREVRLLKGRERANERIAAAIRELAARHDMVDVVLSVHTTRREAEEWASLVPPAARKLRLVYSTACYGNEEERRAWEALGARTIVTHMGINNPVFALPYFLSRWVSGAAVGPAVTTGYERTKRGMAVAVSLPYVDTSVLPDVAGSRPVVTGDAGLTIASGLAGYRPDPARELRVSDRRGAELGTALRALAEPGFRVEGAAVRDVVDLTLLPVALPPDALDRLESIAVESRSRGKLVLSLSDDLSLPLQGGFRMELDETVRLWAGEFDAAEPALEVRASGIWVKKGILGARLSKLRLESDPDGPGYRVSASVAIFGFIPWRHRLRLGGRDPAPIAADGPTFRPLGTAAGPSAGLAGALGVIAD